MYGIRFVFPYNAVTAIAFEWGVDAMKRAVLYLLLPPKVTRN